MLKSVNRPRVSALAWVCAAFALLDHSFSLAHSLRTYGPWMIDMRTAASLLGWILGMLACVVGVRDGGTNCVGVASSVPVGVAGVVVRVA